MKNVTALSSYYHLFNDITVLHVQVHHYSDYDYLTLKEVKYFLCI